MVAIPPSTLSQVTVVVLVAHIGNLQIVPLQTEMLVDQVVVADQQMAP